MTDNITDLKSHKRRKGKLTIEESARLAARRFLDPKYDSVEEPRGLASGKTSETGEFIDDKEEDHDD